MTDLDRSDRISPNALFPTPHNLRPTLRTDRARVAVIGTGWWATATHIPGLVADPRAELVALCDADPDRVKAAALAYGIERTYSDHRAMLAAERPDAVVVATTHATHYVVARDCLDAGAHLLIEKPMTLRAADARELVETAARIGSSIVIGYPWNYMSVARLVRDRLASGEFGPIQFVQSAFNSYNADLLAGRDRSNRPGEYPVHGPGAVYSSKEHSGGGHGHLQITHAAGLLFYVTGLQPARVQARMSSFGLPLDLADVMMVEFAGSALGTVSGTSNAFLPKSTLTIGCANGSIELDVYAGSAVIRVANGNAETLPRMPDTDLRLAPLRNLVGIACGGEENVSPPVVGWRAVELLDAAYRSAERGGQLVDIKELYEL